MSISFKAESPASFSAICIGPEAAVFRARPTTGRIITVVSNAAYLATDDGLILCIVGGEIDGPLTLRVTNFAALLAILRNHPDATFQATENAIHIGSAARIEWAHASYWIPRLHQELGLPEARQSAFDMLSESISRAGRGDGFGSIAQHLVGAWRAMPLRDTFPLDPISSRLLKGIISVCDAVQSGDYAEAARALSSLIGLGHGLTPSGDDLAMGVVAMLVWQAWLGYAPTKLAHQIVDVLSEVAPTRTNHISARLLWHACKGIMYAPAMDVGAALISGNKYAIHAPAKQLFLIGNTTGVDLAVGVLLGALLGEGAD